MRTRSKAIILASALIIPSYSALAKEIIMNCGKNYPWVFKYEYRWFGDRVYYRKNAMWIEECTEATLDTFHQVTDVKRVIKDGGMQCTYEFIRDVGSKGNNFINLDFITLSYEHMGKGNCEKMTNE